MAEKKERMLALRNFTRNLNQLNDLLDESAPPALVTPQYDKVKKCWERLEDAHDAFISVVDDNDMDIETDKDGLSYIDDPNAKYNTMLKSYASYLKTSDETIRTQTTQKEAEERAAEKEDRRQIEIARKEEETQLRKVQTKEKFDSAAAELKLAIDSFSRVNAGLEDTLGTASVSYKQKEWEKVQSEFGSLKNQVITVAGIDPSQDMTDINTKFADTAEKSFLDTKKWLMEALKDAPQDKVVTSSSTGSTKKESVKLPKFEGNEKASPYIKWPSWIVRWEKLIVEYDVSWRSSILIDHLDEAAKEKFVGYDDDYDEAMKRLKSYYGDPRKVVECSIKEVLSPKDIAYGDYKALLFYVDVLEKNYNRLKSLDIEHEMSNTTTMSHILRKFPRSVSEKWVEHLSSLDNKLQSKPFPQFIVWLIKMRFIWEQMVTVDSKSKSSSSSFFGNDAAQYRPTCFTCGEEGHKYMHCPKKIQPAKKPRGPPQFKKFWCAFHKGDPSKKCWTSSCIELRKMADPSKRVQLLKENSDCEHCCGDHKPSDCDKKDRVCGGGKTNRGCTNPHHIHELFCVAAKVFTLQQVHSADSNSEEGVLLLIMSVRGPKGTLASVFWDLGSTSNFIRESYARRCGFKGREETLSVTTLGGVDKDYYTVISYSCRLIALDGTVYEFSAFGMENITGALTTVRREVIQQLFPQLDNKTISCLLRAANVDVLIGASHPSWHPERAERARAGGDLWLFRGLFGVCVGGRHSLIREETRRSDALFTVNHTYHVNSRPLDSIGSHAFEFCPNRVTQYKNTHTVMNIPKIVEIPDELQNTEYEQVDVAKSSTDNTWNISELVELSEESLCADHVDSFHSQTDSLNELLSWDVTAP